jgi:hypothetical protein
MSHFAFISGIALADIKSKCHSGRAQHAAPNKKGNVGRRKTGGAGRQSVVPAARLGTVVG